MYKERTNSYAEAAKLIKEHNIPKVIFLYGRERFLCEWVCKSVKNALLSPAAQSIDCITLEEGAELSEIVSCCETVPFMSERKVVILKDAGAEGIDGLADYISSVPNEACLIIMQDKADKRKALYKSCEKNGQCFEMAALDEATLYGWVYKRFDAAEQKAAKEDIIRFARDMGYFDENRSYTLFNLENDIKKITAFCDKTEITYEDMTAVAAGEDEINTFKLLDAAFSNRKGEAYKLLNTMIENEQSSKQIGAILGFHALLCSQLEIMFEARQRKEAGQSIKQAEQEMKVNSYRLSKAVAASERLSTARLKAALAGCYRLESDIKGGRMNARLALELFIAKI